jgi:hypothetical protein
VPHRVFNSVLDARVTNTNFSTINQALTIPTLTSNAHRLRLYRPTLVDGFSTVRLRHSVTTSPWGNQHLLRQRRIHILDIFPLLMYGITKQFFPRKALIERQGPGTPFAQHPQRLLTLGMLQVV